MLIETTSQGPALKIAVSVTLGDFSVKKDGRVFFRFDVPVISTFDAVEAIKLTGKMLICVAQYTEIHDEEGPPILQTTRLGHVLFAGLSVKKLGESILVLESHEEALSLTLSELRHLREKEMRLSLVYLPINENEG